MHESFEAKTYETKSAEIEGQIARIDVLVAWEQGL